MEKFEYGLSLEELQKRTHKDYLTDKKMLTPDSVEYLELADGDKKALVHLVKASYILEKINTQIDNRMNHSFNEFLKKEIENGVEEAKLTKILYDAQKGICAIDCESNKFSLAKGIKELPQKGLYPSDLTVEDFHSILIKMLNENKVDEVKKILNQRSIVEWNNDELIAIDYIDYFKEDFALMAE